MKTNKLSFKQKLFFIFAFTLLIGLTLHSMAADNFPGSALDFDGSNDCVAIQNESPFDFTSSMTVEAWIRVDTFTKGWQAIVTKGDNSWRLHRYQDTNTISFGTTIGLSNDNLHGSIDVNDGQWHHVAGVYDGSTKYLYVDGNLDASVSASGSIDNSSYQVYIGENAQATGRHFDGKIDEVRAWNVARTATQIRENMHLTLAGNESGLVSYYQFNEGSGTTAGDNAGSNDGTLNGGPPWVDSTVPIGGGMSNSQTVGSTGSVIFTGTNLSMNFSAKSGTDDFTVTKITRAPNTTPSGVDVVFDAQYWVVNQFGSGTFTVDLTFEVNENLSADDEDNPHYIRLYERGSIADGNWSLVIRASSVDSAGNTATFSGINACSQFILARAAPDDFPGSALDFDGSNDCVAIPNESSFDFTNSMTVEAWIKVDAFTKGWQAIVTKGDNSWRLHRYQDTNTISFGTTIGMSNDELYGSIDVNDGQWHHVAGVYDGSMKYLYVDGNFDALVSTSGSIDNSSYQVYIGENAQWMSRSFDGKIEEVRIWNVARTATQIRENMHLTLAGNESGLVSYYQFNKGWGTTAADKVGGNDGTLNGGPPWVGSTVPIGGGTSNSQTVSSTGSVTFTGTNLSMNFTAKSRTNDFTVTKITRAPNTLPTDVLKVFDSQYWIVNQFGSGTFEANLTFTVTEDITPPDESSPGRIRLCRREGVSDGDWFIVGGATNASAANDAATFNNITNFSQFIIGITDFTHVELGLTGVQAGSVAWGDYDNDGDLDILLTGQDVQLFSKVYRNDGGGSFTDIGANLAGVFYSSVAWGDYDNDGDLDILLTGTPSNDYRISKVYRNDGGGSFTDIGASLTGVAAGSVAWGDYDNDGDLDIVLTGQVGSGYDDHVSKVYRNDGGAFTDIGAGIMEAGRRNSAAWGDYDNDGDLDILLTGLGVGGYFICKVYRNDGGNFTDIAANLTGKWWESVAAGVYWSSVAWGDYDNDGDLDILLTGKSFPEIGIISRVYRNNRGSNIFTANNAPNSPSNLQASVSGQNVTLSWTAASDTQTPTDGLTYNLRVGTSSGGVDAVSPMAHIGTYGGRRKIAALGSQNHNTSWTINLTDGTTYYWSAQAIDTGFMSSEFASEGTFTTSVVPPTVTSFSPPDEENIFVDRDLMIQFSKDVYAQSGKNITIHNSGSSVFEQIPADDSRIAVSGGRVTINPTSDLVDGNSYYVNIDAGAFKDATGNDYAGINDNTTWNFTGTQTDDFPGNALDFDGSNDYVAIENESPFDFTNSMTVEVWIKVDAFTKDWQAIVTKGSNSWRLRRYWDANIISFNTIGLSNDELCGSINVNDGQWHHVAGVYTVAKKRMATTPRWVLSMAQVILGCLQTMNTPTREWKMIKPISTTLKILTSPVPKANPMSSRWLSLNRFRKSFACFKTSRIRSIPIPGYLTNCRKMLLWSFPSITLKGILSVS